MKRKRRRGRKDTVTDVKSSGEYLGCMFRVAMYYQSCCIMYNNGQLIILASVVQTLFDLQDAASDMLCAYYTLDKLNKISNTYIDIY